MAPSTSARARPLHVSQRPDGFGAVFIGDGPERAAFAHASRGVPGVTFTGALPHATMPAAWRRPTSASRRSTSARIAPLSLGFYWSPLKIFEYMAVGLPVVAPALAGFRRSSSTGAKASLYDPAEPARPRPRRSRALADPALAPALGAAARARVVRDFSWAAHCAALEAARRGETARMTMAAMNSCAC